MLYIRGVQYISHDQLIDCHSKNTFLFLMLSYHPFYLSKLTFSYMKIKSKYQFTMTDDYLETCLGLATNSYCPDYATLTHSIQCKSSEYGSDHKCIQLYCAIRVHAMMQHIQTHFINKVYLGSIHGVVVTIIGNGHGKTNSNPRWSCLHFT